MRALLADPGNRDGYIERSASTTGLDWARIDDKPWLSIQLWTASKCIGCYYRETSPGSFVVSDCGESVSGIMRRTGKHGSEAQLATAETEGVVDERRHEKTRTTAGATAAKGEIDREPIRDASEHR